MFQIIDRVTYVGKSHQGFTQDLKLERNIPFQQPSTEIWEKTLKHPNLILLSFQPPLNSKLNKSDHLTNYLQNSRLSYFRFWTIKLIITKLALHSNIATP